jgi:hypothetical protein
MAGLLTTAAAVLATMTAPAVVQTNGGYDHNYSCPPPPPGVPLSEWEKRKKDFGGSPTPARMTTTTEEESELAVALRLLPLYLDAEGQEQMFRYKHLERPRMVDEYYKLRDILINHPKLDLPYEARQIIDITDKALQEGHKALTEEEKANARTDYVKPMLMDRNMTTQVVKASPFKSYKPLLLTIGINNQWEVQVYPQQNKGGKRYFHMVEDPAPTIALTRLPNDPTKVSTEAAHHSSIQI